MDNTFWHKINNHISLKRLILILALLSIQTQIISQNKFKIGILYSLKPQAVMLNVVSGEYKIYSNKTLVRTFKKGDIVLIEYLNGEVKLKDLKGGSSMHSSLYFKGHLSYNAIKIKAVRPGKPPLVYEDDFLINPKSGHLSIVNYVSSVHYLSGVVESEGGPSAPFEFYKAQALLCRTYAAGHLNRHKEEGFQLCDGVHCQAYHGMSHWNNEIPLAVEETGTEVVTDRNGKLITAAYHSNCGGETVNSENVWSQALPYLQGIEEHYCLSSRNSRWESLIGEKEWEEYLLKQGLIDSLEFTDSLLSFEQKNRKVYLKMGSDSIPLKKIRSDWRFKSTYFEVIPIDDQVLIDGRGYGHGVGMCQEGAMQMARNGYNYKEILEHYYRMIEIRNLSETK